MKKNENPVPPPSLADIISQIVGADCRCYIVIAIDKPVTTNVNERKAHDSIAVTDRITTTEIAREFGMTAQKLNSILHEYKVQYKQNDQWFLYRRYVGHGYTAPDKCCRSNGKSAVCTYWTQAGRIFIHEILSKHGIFPIV